MLKDSLTTAERAMRPLRPGRGAGVLSGSGLRVAESAVVYDDRFVDGGAESDSGEVASDRRRLSSAAGGEMASSGRRRAEGMECEVERIEQRSSFEEDGDVDAGQYGSGRGASRRRGGESGECRCGGGEITSI